jgi:N-methylhydantoinase A
VPAVARALGKEVSIPPDAEVISSVGDALSLVRVELEHSVARGDPGAASSLCRRAEEAALASGASPETIRVESEAVPERAAIRAVAVGALALDSGASLEAAEADEEGRRATAEAELGARAELVVDNGFYSVFAAAGEASRSFVIVDRFGAIAGRGRGRVLAGSGSEVEGELQHLLPSMTRHYGPISVAPEVRLLSGPRLLDLTLLSSPEAALSAARAECAGANGHRIVALLSRA